MRLLPLPVGAWTTTWRRLLLRAVRIARRWPGRHVSYGKPRSSGVCIRCHLSLRPGEIAPEPVHRHGCRLSRDGIREPFECGIDLDRVIPARSRQGRHDALQLPHELRDT
jgi:hypothetical protein